MKSIIKIVSIIILAALINNACTKPCDSHHSTHDTMGGSGVWYPYTIENRSDTILMSDSIIIDLKIPITNYAPSAGRYYDLDEYTMEVGLGHTHIDDSLPLGDFPVQYLSANFELNVLTGGPLGVNGYKPLIEMDTFYYKFSLKPLNSGLFEIYVGITEDEEYHVLQKGYVVDTDEEGCQIFVRGMDAKPSLDTEIEDYNNFDLYYYSGFYWPASPNAEYEELKERGSTSYYVYVVE